ncbi:hypothetical protein [Spiroplasma floricola]|uniref:Transmembrane protein n=1 Tax=Spiroplasma floricola 23-6 TaxID=1336749 RepID=A0A2K8SDY0_9MOLU|nr:hypothetical protein [Spiroplasma floricola]AUB31659.1 hypothetical protein SFLOR_v1c06090 [Spiroplasma floricola 23-6]
MKKIKLLKNNKKPFYMIISLMIFSIIIFSYSLLMMLSPIITKENMYQVNKIIVSNNFEKVLLSFLYDGKNLIVAADDVLIYWTPLIISTVGLIIMTCRLIIHIIGYNLKNKKEIIKITRPIRSYQLTMTLSWILLILLSFTSLISVLSASPFILGISFQFSFSSFISFNKDIADSISKLLDGQFANIYWLSFGIFHSSSGIWTSQTEYKSSDLILWILLPTIIQFTASIVALAGTICGECSWKRVNIIFLKSLEEETGQKFVKELIVKEKKIKSKNKKEKVEDNESSYPKVLETLETTSQLDTEKWDIFSATNEQYSQENDTLNIINEIDKIKNKSVNETDEQNDTLNLINKMKNKREKSLDSTTLDIQQITQEDNTFNITDEYYNQEDRTFNVTDEIENKKEESLDSAILNDQQINKEDNTFTITDETNELENNQIERHETINDSYQYYENASTKCILYFKSIKKMFEDSNNQNSILYKQTIEKLEQIQNTKDINWDYIGSQIEIEINNLTSTDKKFVDLIEELINNSELNLFGRLKIDLEELIDYYKFSLKTWDLFTAEVQLERIFIISFKNEKLLPKIGFCLKNRVSSIWKNIDEKSNVINRLEIANNNQDLKNYRDICLEIIQEMSPIKATIANYINKIIYN